MKGLCKMRRSIKIFIILLFISFLTSCFSSNSQEKESFPTGATAKALAIDIFNCFLEKDSEMLKNYFSPYIQNVCDLDLQIDEAFSFIDGEILSYDEPKGQATGSHVENGEWLKRTLSGKIKNIKTDKGQTYEIIIKYYAIEKNNPDKVGCSAILIKNMNQVNEQGEVLHYIIGG